MISLFDIWILGIGYITAMQLPFCFLASLCPYLFWVFFFFACFLVSVLLLGILFFACLLFHPFRLLKLYSYQGLIFTKLSKFYATTYVNIIQNQQVQQQQQQLKDNDGVV